MNISFILNSKNSSKLLTRAVSRQHRSPGIGEILCPKGAYGITNSVDPDQTALKDQSDLGLHCLFRPICPNT